MKKVLIMLALVVSAVSFTKAQGGAPGGRQMGTPEERAQRTIDGQQLASLSLTADQKAKLLPLLVKANKSTDSLRTAMTPDGDRAAMMAKMTSLSEPAEKALVAMLTPDQKKAYDTALAAAKERRPTATGILSGGFPRGGGQGGPPAGAPPQE